MRDFLNNIARYPRYLISFSLGVLYSVYEWFKPLLKNRITAVAFVGMVVGVFLLMFFTLRAMLGLSTV
ncbi:MAG: DUF751 family protein [Cyanobacteriota bacterium]|nr:DUF751 family protein [Cyanobacteriota bacterium]